MKRRFIAVAVMAGAALVAAVPAANAATPDHHGALAPNTAPEGHPPLAENQGSGQSTDENQGSFA